jgi:HlyD family secretion protein
MWRRIGCIALIVIVLGVTGIVIWRQRSGEGFKFSAGAGKKDDPDKKPNFEPARRGDLSITVEATGTTEPVSDIEVKSEATGRIVEFTVEEGDRVAKGDVIARLDQSNQVLVVKQQRIQVERAKLAYQEAKNASSNTQRSGLETAVVQAQSSVTAAEQALEQRRAELARYEELTTRGYVTTQELETAQLAVDSALESVRQANATLSNARTQLAEFDASSDRNAIEQARLQWEAAKVSLQESEKQLGDSVINSPIDGIVLEKPLDVGDSVVSINSAFGQANPVVKVADLSRIKVSTNVDEIDIGKIKIGQPATITVDAFPEREFTGSVTNIFPQGRSSGQGLINFIAIVEVDNAGGQLLGNMTANVRIQTDSIKDVLLVPLAATRAGELPDTTIVVVLKEGQDAEDPKAETEDRLVKTGDTDYKDVVILDGLMQGELVKVRGFKTEINFGG